MIYLKGTFEECKAYNDLVYTNRFAEDIGTTCWMQPIERDGDFYILKHPDYPATTGLIEAELPELPEEGEPV